MEQLIFFVSNVEIFGYYYKSNNSSVPSGDAIDNVDIKLVSLPIVMYQPFKLQYIHIYEYYSPDCSSYISFNIFGY